MAKAKGKVTFREDRCKGCELCTTVCPVNIVVMNKEKINIKGYHPATVSDMDKCIGCANCATICPDTVIEVERVIEK
ncbi:4Fe-4S dicluster domain-containing protein [Senegalia massiliensis]|uniref:4Fe-4S dicluster domain-containing protein n=1 Tax=Senegalia massiliensis TaxID=1720316 RepID=A0A845R0J3_9CLOT|nr:4Fe-4S dicluster domain-containing protein [Senegalia massiliensis]NBI07754.1 4Fe-4S dicluster domain-containing protein [Senegalia massiliensis]